MKMFKHVSTFIFTLFLASIHNTQILLADTANHMQLVSVHEYGKDIKNAFLQDYGLPIQDMYRAEHGLENDVYIIRTQKKKFVLRVYANRNFNKVLDEVKLQKILKEHSYIRSCIPHMIPGKDGSYIHKVETRDYVVFEFIPGSHPSSFDKKTISQILNILYNIHQATFNIKSQFNHREINAIIKETNLFLQDALNNSIMTKEESIKLKIIVLKFVQNFNIQNFYTTVIHFDVHSKNIIINKDQVFLIDFDDFLVGSPLLELAVLIRGTCFNSRGNFNVALADYILESYPFYKITGEYLNKKLVYQAILFDLIRVIAANVKKEKSEKRKVFLKYYERILFIENFMRRAKNADNSTSPQ